MLGLLGTVSGMIETFQSITLFGTGDPKLVSGGISQALVTTELGLAVAIPILLIHSALSSKSNRLIQILDEESASIVARNAEHHSNKP
jgi:biopolymer transport protein ExbB